MRKSILLTTAAIFVLVSPTARTSEIREPAVAGRFYPDQPKKLREMVEAFLGQAERKLLEGELVALVSPHAGYTYSGAVAAYSYKQVEGTVIDTVVLIGPSHYASFPGVSVGNFGSYQTPLGSVLVDGELAKDILKEKGILFNAQAHQREHSLEVQLPFLQEVLGDFTILPLLTGEVCPDTCRMLAEVLIKLTKNRNVLFITSSDLSHYHPYDEAVRLDNKTIQAIKILDAEALLIGAENREYELCGASAVATVMLIAEKLGATEAKVLEYATSGDVGRKDKSWVVGYVAIAITKTRSKP